MVTIFLTLVLIRLQMRLEITEIASSVGGSLSSSFYMAYHYRWYCFPKSLLVDQSAGERFIISVIICQICCRWYLGLGYSEYFIKRLNNIQSWKDMWNSRTVFYCEVQHMCGLKLHLPLHRSEGDRMKTDASIFFLQVPAVFNSTDWHLVIVCCNTLWAGQQKLDKDHDHMDLHGLVCLWTNISKEQLIIDALVWSRMSCP